MTLPTLEKTWQFNVNNFLANPGNDAATFRGLLLAIKNALVGFASAPWVVVSSSNSLQVSAGDLWLSKGSLVTGNPRSWIVLEQAGISQHFQLCLELSHSSAYSYATIAVSPSVGFVGGTTSARPQAPDEIVLIDNTSWINENNSVATRWSALQTTDGSQTVIVTCIGGGVKQYAIFGVPGDPVAGWSDPSFSFWRAQNPNASELCAAAGYGKIRAANTIGDVTMMATGSQSATGPLDGTWANVANQITGEWPMFPITLGCVTNPIRGAHGRVIDLFLSSNGAFTGDRYPANPPGQFAQFGSLIVPWNGGPVDLS